MDFKEISKKLEEIKVDAYNNLSSGEEESELQLESVTEFPVEEDAAGEEIKPERTKGETYKLPDTLSRTNPMDGNKTRAKPEVYLNEEGEKVKKTTSEEIWSKLEDLKKNSIEDMRRKFEEDRMNDPINAYMDTYKDLTLKLRQEHQQFADKAKRELRKIWNESDAFDLSEQDEDRLVDRLEDLAHDLGLGKLDNWLW